MNFRDKLTQRNVFRVATGAIAATALLLFSFAESQSRQYTYEFHKELPVSPGFVFSLTDPIGDIVVEGYAGRSIEIAARKVVEASSRRKAAEWEREVRIEIDRRENQVTLKTEYPGHRTRNNLFDFLYSDDSHPRGQVNYRIRIPESGTVSLHTTSGNCYVAHAKDRVELNSTSGDLEIIGIDGAVLIETTSGDVIVREVSGNLDLATTSADLTIADARGALRIKSVSGDIHLSRLTGDLTVESTSGDVQADGVQGEVRVTTVSGDVTVSGQTGGCYLTTISGDIETKIAQLTGASALATTSGDIHLFLPEEADAALSIATRGGEIETHLPLALQSVKRHQVEGTLGRGSHRLEMKSTSGDIAVASF